MWSTSRATRPARGFTLVEVLVALTIFSVGVLGVLAGLSLAGRAGGHGENFARAAAICEQQIQQAALPASPNLAAKRGSTDRYTWKLEYHRLPHGLARASVTVNWLQNGQPEELQLHRLIRLRQKQ